tara:strand:+ start:3381 stop:3893 length:513 start_codon:yes stop_codon:yes gene_type:complete
MLNIKNKSIIIFLIGIVSYLYLFLSLLNKKYNVIFIYFTILFTGYLIIGNKIFLYNLLIIIIDIINNKFILREGNTNNTDDDEKFTKEFDGLVKESKAEGGESKYDDIEQASEIDSGELGDGLDGNNNGTDTENYEPSIVAQMIRAHKVNELNKGVDELNKGIDEVLNAK